MKPEHIDMAINTIIAWAHHQGGHAGITENIEEAKCILLPNDSLRERECHNC